MATNDNGKAATTMGRQQQHWQGTTMERPQRQWQYEMKWVTFRTICCPLPFLAASDLTIACCSRKCSSFCSSISLNYLLNRLRLAMNYFCSSLCFDVYFMVWSKIDPLALHFGAAMLSATCDQTCPEVDQKMRSWLDVCRSLNKKVKSTGHDWIWLKSKVVVTVKIDWKVDYVCGRSFRGWAFDQLSIYCIHRTS